MSNINPTARLNRALYLAQHDVTEGRISSAQAHVLALRASRQWSQETLAARVEVTPETVCRWESGARVPSLPSAQWLSFWGNMPPTSYMDTFPLNTTQLLELIEFAANERTETHA